MPSRKWCGNQGEDVSRQVGMGGSPGKDSKIHAAARGGGLTPGTRAWMEAGRGPGVASGT